MEFHTKVGVLQHPHPARARSMTYDKWKIVGNNGQELVQLHLEGGRITARFAPPSGVMTTPPDGHEEPVTMPREHADALAFILANSSLPDVNKAKAIRA